MPSGEHNLAWLATNFPCRQACPVGTNAGGYVSLLASGRAHEAFALFKADWLRNGKRLASPTSEMPPISVTELADGYVKNVTDVVKVGDSIRVKVISVDDQGRIKLSRKALLAEEAESQDVEEAEPAEASA